MKCNLSSVKFTSYLRFGIMILYLSPVGAAVARSLDMGKVIGSNPILGTIYNPRFTTRISYFILILWPIRTRARKGRFLRVFAGFCSFIVNILAMTFRIQTGLLNSFYWQFVKIVSSELVNLRGKGEKIAVSGGYKQL